MRSRTTRRSTTPTISTRTDPLRAVVTTGAGGPEVLSVGEVEEPRPGAGEVLLDVVATAVNRADTLQRKGVYPPPPGASEVIGLECSGRIAELGEGVEGWKVGDEVCALLAGGGNAARVAVPVGQVMPVPAGLSLVEAAGLPEVAATVWSNVFMTAHLQKGERLLVHGGAGGIGTMAIQLASALGAEVFTTAGSPEKLELCRSLGAAHAINYRDEDFVEVLEKAGGADVILDNMGAKYLGRNVSALATGGRLVIIGMQGGATGELDINALLRKRASVTATSLRARPLAEKTAICCGVVENVWPLVASGKVRPIVEATMPLEDVARAHELMETGGHAGKFVLTL
ncbi:NAD(P)H-quinone oxidoreductase [Nocardioides hwasunensis]|uniref:NAD(P)H-quinone oxidoreductase n=1 Tax=Nocardioides hwasunensis TaxID=397258 RepID=A0ABR8MN39_9ACTN|nr:NAD(P)H-quinone oxidoreductase [Nocardioides hwasunensis]